MTFRDQDTPLNIQVHILKVHLRICNNTCFDILLTVHLNVFILLLTNLMH